MKSVDRSAIWICGALFIALLLTAACRPIQAPATSAPPAPQEAITEINTLDSETTARIEKAVMDTMSERWVPGMALCVIKDGQVAYTKGFGVMTVGADKPVTPQSMFQLMDAGRPLVAAAVMQLVEQDKVDLDAPITTYLPYFQMKDDRYKQLTVRQLLTSNSGLPGPDPVFVDNWAKSPPQYDDGALERNVRSLADTRLYNRPGTMFGYSNWDYEILGDMIAKVSGQTFEAYMEEHVFTPLGMTQSTYRPKQANPELLVSPHMNKGKDVFVSDVATDGREHGPSLGLWSNVEDACRWLMADLNRGELDGQRILDDASYDSIWEPTVATYVGSPVDRVSMGWYVGTQDGHQRLTGIGFDVGFHSNIRLVPDEKFGLVLLTNLYTDEYQNGAPVYGWGLSETIMDILRH